MIALGAGMDRSVHLISPDKVIKVAKNTRGIVQNSFEGIKELEELGLVPKVFYREETFVICERVKPLDHEEQKNPIFTQMVNLDFEEEQDEIRTILKSIGCEKYLEYNLHKRDFCNPANWGMKGEQLIVLDGGVFMGKLLDDLVIESKNLNFL